MLELGKTTAYDEIYLFSQTGYSLSSHDIFKYHSETTGTIDAHTMQRLAINLQLPTNAVQREKPLYDFSDIVDLNLESKEETCKTCHYSRPHPVYASVGMLRCHRQVPPWANVEATDWCGVWSERWVPYDD